MKIAPNRATAISATTASWDIGRYTAPASPLSQSLERAGASLDLVEQLTEVELSHLPGLLQGSQGEAARIIIRPSVD